MISSFFLSCVFLPVGVTCSSRYGQVVLNNSISLDFPVICMHPTLVTNKLTQQKECARWFWVHLRWANKILVVWTLDFFLYYTHRLYQITGTSTARDRFSCLLLIPQQHYVMMAYTRHRTWFWFSFYGCGEILCMVHITLLERISSSD